MASAVLVSRNEPSWGDRKLYMRKYPNTVATAAAAVSNYNAPFKAKPRRNLSPYRKNHARRPSANLHVKDASSIVPGFPKRKQITLREAEEASRVGLVTFNLDACTRRELNDLKSRLLSELEQVRILRTRIESTNFETRSDNPTTPPIRLVAHATGPHQPSRNCTPKGKKKGRGPKRANPFGNSAEKVVAGMMKRCRQILEKVMKYKHGWVFNAPVDVVGLGLHDYHKIIETPMDLGTVKSNLDRNVYKSPLEFASDVRLTFNNALKYNPKDHGVHFMAETLLAKFEGMFNSEAKGTEANKRVMSTDEKKTLGRSLADLPQEKTAELLDIMEESGGGFARDGEEIVLDMEALDDDTLWELDGFMCKIKKQEAIEEATAMEKASGCTEWSNNMEIGEEEEDVDIGEEIPVEYYPPVEIERDVSSSSSSSGSDGSSSSSDSDSGSSSDDNDDNGVQSKDS